MTLDEPLATFKRHTREALNEARALFGLPPKMGPLRRLAPDDPVCSH
jgi:hypothetical protein